MEQYTVAFTPRAERQLARLYERIADDSGTLRAEHYIGGIVEDCRSLTTFPERGTKRDDIRPNLRIKGYGKRITIAFSVNLKSKVVAIHGVFYGGQNFESLLHDTDNND